MATNPYDRFDPNPYDRFDTDPLTRAIETTTQETEGRPPPTMGDMFKAAGEAALTIGTGAVASTYGGAKAVIEEMWRASHGDPGGLDQMVSTIKGVEHRLTYAPTTEGGKIILSDVQRPLEYLEKGKKWLGDKVMDLTGNPELATASYSAPDVLAMLLGGFLTKPKISPIKRRGDMLEAEKQASEMGIDINAPKAVQAEQLAAAARKERGDIAVKGESSEVIAQEVASAKDAAKMGVDDAYGRARASGVAGIEHGEMLNTFAPMVAKALEGVNMKLNRRVRVAVEELEAITQNPWRAATVDELEGWYKGINKNWPKSTDRSQIRALTRLKGAYNRFMQAQFDADMVIGDAAAISKWRDARQANARYMKTFEEDRLIRDLAEREATPEEIRSWIFGSMQVGMKKEASRFVRSVKDVVGPKSPAMEAIRQDATLNIVEPLLRDEPNLTAFVKNYDDIVWKNQSVMRELFNDSSMRTMRDFAQAIESHGRTPTILVDRIPAFIARITVGHQIARKGALVNVSARIAEMVAKAANTSSRHKILGEILGYDVTAPALPKSPVLIGGLMQSGATEPHNLIAPSPQSD